MFKVNLKQLRKERDLTQTDLARELHISLGAVGNWEAGNRVPDANMLIVIADFFGTSVDRLIRDHDDKEVESLFSTKEKRLISAYRNQPDIQLAVDRLLGIDTPLHLTSTAETRVAAFGGEQTTTPLTEPAKAASTLRNPKKKK